MKRPPLTRILTLRGRRTQAAPIALRLQVPRHAHRLSSWRPTNAVFQYEYRPFATQAQTGSWSSLSPSEQAAWMVLHYDQESWEGRRRAPPRWKEWRELTLEEQAAAMHGLGIATKQEWDTLAPPRRQVDVSSSMTDVPSLSSLLKEEKEKNDSTTSASSRALVVAQETRLARQQTQQSSGLGGALGKMAYQTVKGLAPVVGPWMRAAGNQSRGGRGAVGLALAGSLLEHLPTVLDATSGVLEITGIDTLVYLDDSASMQGSNLREGQEALQSLETRLKTASDDADQRYLPTRIVKFGNHATVLNPSEEDWNVSLVNAAWDGSSGGTYMWKMIQDDIKNRYRPVGGKLRVVVITDGYDIISPPPYKGVRGFDPLMRTLLREGFDIEWNIIVVGNDDGGMFGQHQQELSAADKKLYESLCRATGGQFLSLGSSAWDEDDDAVSGFLEGVEDSGHHDSEHDRRERQEQYKLEARKGKAENFDWLPSLPDKFDDK
jgi:hypothetical protein